MADNGDGNILDDLVAKAKEVGEQVKEFAADAFDNAKEFADDTVDKGRDAFDDLKDRFDGDHDATDPAAPAESADETPEPQHAPTGEAPGTPAEPDADDLGSVHDAPVTDSVEDAADELAASHSDHADSAQDASSGGSSGEADPSDQPLPGESSGDLGTGEAGELADAGVNDFGSGHRPVESFGDTETSALDAPPEGPDADTSKPLS